MIPWKICRGRPSETHGNGDGILVSQTISGTTTRFTQDLASPLPNILQITSGGVRTDVVYGTERLGWLRGGAWTWTVGDALGSVRVLLPRAGTPGRAQTSDAWGLPQQPTSAPFGFTGEYTDQALVYLRARWYDPRTGRFGSRDAFEGWPTRPYSVHPYQYAYGDPVRWTDPSGKCPKPPAGMGSSVICMALFIAPAEVSVKFTNISLHGDNRGFDSNSNPSQSRGYIWINTDTGQATPHMNPTGYIFSLAVPICTVPINDDGTFGPPQLGLGQSRGGLSGGSIDYFPPSTYNIWQVTKVSDESIQVKYELVLSGYLEQVAPKIDGTILFYKDEDGNYSAYGERDGFPWAEAYHHINGAVRTIFQRPAVRGDPEDLNAIEGEYRYWIPGRAGYEFRRRFLADSRPLKDFIGSTPNQPRRR